MRQFTAPMEDPSADFRNEVAEHIGTYRHDRRHTQAENQAGKE